MFIIQRIVRGRRLLKEARDARQVPTTEKSHSLNSTPVHRSSTPSSTGTASLQRALSMRAAPLKAQSVSHLNAYQKRALRFTWQKMYSKNTRRAVVVMEHVFATLLQKWPELNTIFLKDVFASERAHGLSATVHAKLLVRTIDELIVELEGTPADAPPPQFESLRQIGETHRRFKRAGLHAEYWERLGQVLIDELFKQDAVRDFPGAARAWVVFVALITDQIRFSFEDDRPRARSLCVKQSAPPNKLQRK